MKKQSVDWGSAFSADMFDDRSRFSIKAPVMLLWENADFLACSGIFHEQSGDPVCDVTRNVGPGSEAFMECIERE